MFSHRRPYILNKILVGPESPSSFAHWLLSCDDVKLRAKLVAPMTSVRVSQLIKIQNGDLILERNAYNTASMWLLGLKCNSFKYRI